MTERSLTVRIRADMLRSWLRVTGWTQTRLAAALGVSKGRVSQLFSANGVDPSAHLIAALLHITGMPFERLFRIGGAPAGRRRTGNVRGPVIRSSVKFVPLPRRRARADAPSEPITKADSQ